MSIENSMPNFLEIVKSSKNTFEKTCNDKLDYFMDIFIRSCDVLQQLWRVSNPPVRNSQDLMKDNDFFQGLCFSRYVQAPYSLFCLIELWAKGFYTEAYMVYRSLFEAFIQMRYFYKYNCEAKSYSINENDLDKQYKPNHKKIINELLNIKHNESSYLYKFYQTYLCSASHGISKINETRFNVSALNIDIDIGTPFDGCVFNKEHAEVIATQTVLLILGYINYFQIFFSENILDEIMESKALFEHFKFIQTKLIEILDTYESKDEFTSGMLKDFKKIVQL
jgi:hypothetical protein